MSSFVERMIGAAKLDPRIYEEVEADPNALGQALTVVVLSALAAGIGGLRAGVGAMVAALVGALVGWLVWALLTWLIGTKLLPEAQTQADIGQLLRTLGFAAAPGVLRVFGIIPILGFVVNLVVFFWMLAAFVIAVRQALDYTSTGRAIAVCFIGFLAYLFVAFGIALVLGVGAAVGGAMTG